uniref:Uncharacterized protein n=1 Tax=Vespula pensylvanica TaxID=30213 RepID=A0A834K474_VESPE|nr:hypothetical protein H0235_015856 [Vespula pensylvanica]
MLEKDKKNKGVGWNGKGLELKGKHKGTRNNASKSLMESGGIEFHAAENMTTHRRATLFNGYVSDIGTRTSCE